MMNYLNNDFDEYHKSIGQVEPIPEPAPQNPEEPDDDEKEESV